MQKGKLCSYTDKNLDSKFPYVSLDSKRVFLLLNVSSWDANLA